MANLVRVEREIRKEAHYGQKSNAETQREGPTGAQVCKNQTEITELKSTRRLC